MAWAKFIGSVVKDSNQLTLLGSLPASQVPKGYEVLIDGIGNYEVSHGTSVMYDSEDKPFSHLYLVRAYTGETSNDVEVIIKPTGSNLNEAVDIFRSGSNQLNQLTALYRQFVEGNSPFTYQPFDETEEPIEIKPILLLQSESDLILSNLTDSTNAAIQNANTVIGNANQAVTDSLEQISATIFNVNQILNDSVAQSEEKIDAAIVASSQTVNDSITQYGVTIDAAITSANQSISASVSQSETRIDNAIASADQAVIDNKSLINAAVATADQAITNNQTQLDIAIASANQTVSDSVTLSQSNVSNFIESSSQELTQERITQSQVVQELSNDVHSKILDMDALFSQALAGASRKFTVSGDPNNIVLTSKLGAIPITELKNFDEFSFIVAETNTSTVTIKIDDLEPIPLSGVVAPKQIFLTAMLTVRYIDGSFYIASQTNPKTGNSVLDIAVLSYVMTDILRPGEYALDGSEFNSKDHPIFCAIAAASSNYVAQAIKDADIENYCGYFGFVEELDDSTTVTLPVAGGDFIRLFDDGRGVNPDQEFGRWKPDELRNHSHSFAVYSMTGSLYGGGNNAGFRSAAGAYTRYTNSTGGSENRPRSIAYYGKTRL